MTGELNEPVQNALKYIWIHLKYHCSRWCGHQHFPVLNEGIRHDVWKNAISSWLANWNTVWGGLVSGELVQVHISMKPLNENTWNQFAPTPGSSIVSKPSRVSAQSDCTTAESRLRLSLRAKRSEQTCNSIYQCAKCWDAACFFVQQAIECELWKHWTTWTWSLPASQLFWCQCNWRNHEGIFQPCCALGPPKALTVVACALLVLFLSKAGIEISRFCATCPTVIVWIWKDICETLFESGIPTKKRRSGTWSRI